MTNQHQRQRQAHSRQRSQLQSKSQSTTSLVSVLVLFLGVGLVQCLEYIPLPHVDIYMLCSNDVADLDFIKELDGYYTDLLPSAADVEIIDGEASFEECAADTNRTQVRISSEGLGTFDNDNVLTQESIQALVTSQSLATYFAASCETLDTFEAVVSPAESAPQVGIEGALNHFYCEADAAGVVARTVKTFAIVSIVIGVVILICIIACICTCCGFCGSR